MGIILFLAAFALLVYVIVGYPLYVILMARLAPRPVLKLFRPRTVTIILPVHNGSAWIQNKLDSLLALTYPEGLVDIIVISDGSDDGTDRIVERYADRAVRLLCLPKSGKSSALNAGIEMAQGEILFLTDVRQTIATGSLRSLVEHFEDPTVGVVSGELYIVDSQTQQEVDVGLYWRYEKFIRKSISKFSSVPGATGCIYAMRRDLVRPLPPYTLCDDMYLPLAAHLLGYRIVFDESAQAFDQPTGLKTEFGRKVRTLAGVYQIVYRLPGLMNPLVPVFPHFVSLKLGRLLLPHALIVMFLASLFIPGALGYGLLSAQTAFYALAALDPLFPERTALKRITSLARTFVVLMGAALCACAIFFRPAKSLWKPTRL